MFQNNEPAFPGQWIDRLPTTGEEVVREQWSGMSLRDYFAAKAMAVFAVENSIQISAEMAYVQADAMLKAREKEHDET